MKKTVLVFIILILTASAYGAENKARDIMVKVDNRDDGQTLISRVSLTTYRYIKKGGKNIPAEKPRVKVIDFIKKDYGIREKDHKSISIVIEPKSEKGIGFLQYDYEESGKDTDQWMYLSAMRKVKRIVSGNDNEPKTGSFFGSEFNYEDMEAHNINDYTYRLPGSETYKNKHCHVIEAIPIPEKAKKSNYSRALLWVDSKDFIILKSVLFNRNGKKNKKIYNNRIVKIEGILVPREIVVINLTAHRRTTMTYGKIALNSPVEDRFLTRRTLTDKGFRKRKLDLYQKVKSDVLVKSI